MDINGNASFREMSDRQCRAVIAVAETRGFERTPGMLFWQYDLALHSDGARAAAFLHETDSDALQAALVADDPIPTWAAVERMVDRGVGQAEMERIVMEAAARDFVDPDPHPCPPFGSPDWDLMKRSLGHLWEQAPELLREILDDRGTIASLPESAIMRCPSCCDDGWIPHPFAGPLPPEPDGRGDRWRWR